jgi:hypothetical protein
MINPSQQLKPSPEVLIYIQSVKNFFNNDDQTKNYFIFEGNEDLFYNQMTQVCQMKFEKDGETMLTIEEFEIIRLMVIQMATIKENINRKKTKDIFIDYREFGLFFLN